MVMDYGTDCTIDAEEKPDQVEEQGPIQDPGKLRGKECLAKGLDKLPLK